jgi:hypothetical protein
VRLDADREIAQADPVPGALWPAMVRKGFFTVIGFRSAIVPDTRNTTMRGPAASHAARRLPGPESFTLSTNSTRPPRPPGVVAPKPSAPGKDGKLGAARARGEKGEGEGGKAEQFFIGRRSHHPQSRRPPASTSKRLASQIGRAASAAPVRPNGSAQEGLVQAAVDRDDLAGGLAEPLAHEEEVRLGLVGRRDRRLRQCAVRVELRELADQRFGRLVLPGRRCCTWPASR